MNTALAFATLGFNRTNEKSKLEHHVPFSYDLARLVRVPDVLQSCPARKLWVTRVVDVRYQKRTLFVQFDARAFPIIHVLHGKCAVNGTHAQRCRGMERRESECDPQIIFLSANPSPPQPGGGRIHRIEETKKAKSAKLKFLKSRKRKNKNSKLSTSQTLL
jgi:hypothetical protein